MLQVVIKRRSQGLVHCAAPEAIHERAGFPNEW